MVGDLPRFCHRSGRGPSRPFLVASALAGFLGCLPLHAGLLDGATRFGAQLRATSDYVYRGYSKTRGHPTVQLGLSADGASGWFAAAWASPVEFGAARFEFNPTLGWQGTLAPDWRVEGTAAAYLYDGRTFGDGNGYPDFGARLRYRDVLSVRAGVAPDAYGTGETISGVETDARYPLTDVTELSGVIGHSFSAAAVGYDQTYFGIGMTHYLGRHLALELRYQGARESNADSARILRYRHADYRRGHSASAGNPTTANPESAFIADRVVLSLSIGF